MFLSSLHTPLVALVAYVAVVSSTSSASAPPSLSVKTSISDPDIDGVGNLKVTATIVNTGGESLKLFNDPRGVLDPFPDDSFTFANPSGSRPSFKGARASYNSTLAASPDGPGVFTVLAPGGSVNVTHDLSAAYDFTRSGTGEYSIEPSNHFTYIDADGTPKDLYATVGDIAKVKLSGDLGVSRHVHNKRVEYPQCQEAEVNEIRRAVRTARYQIKIARRFLRRINPLSTVPYHYTFWFGHFNHAFWQNIKDRLEAMHHQDTFRDLAYVCLSQTRQGTTRRTSHIYFEEGNDYYLYINPTFLDGLRREQQAHLLIHQAARMYGATDRGIGVDACIDLVRTEPGAAAGNADNIAYFAAGVPFPACHS